MNCRMDGTSAVVAMAGNPTRTSAWDWLRLGNPQTTRLLELFVLGLPLYRQRFDTSIGASHANAFTVRFVPAWLSKSNCAPRLAVRWNTTKPCLAGLATANMVGVQR